VHAGVLRNAAGFRHGLRADVGGDGLEAADGVGREADCGGFLRQQAGRRRTAPTPWRRMQMLDAWPHDFRRCPDALAGVTIAAGRTAVAGR